MLGLLLRPALLGLLIFSLVPSISASQTMGSLTISGEINIAVSRISNGAPSYSGIFDDGSQWTLRSKEVIDSSTVVGIKLQSGIDLPTGAGGRFGRDSLIWAQIGNGKIFVGRLLTVYDDVSTMWYFPVGGAQNPNALWANCSGGGGAAEGCLDTYMNSSVRFDYRFSKEFDVSGSVSIPDALSENVPHRTAVSFGARYVGEPNTVAMAIQRNIGYRRFGSDDRGITISTESDNPAVGRFAIALESINYFPENAQQQYLGMLFARSVSNWTGWLNYGLARARNGSNHQIGAIASSIGTDWTYSRMYTIGVQYALSKSVSINAHVSRISNTVPNMYTFSSLDMPVLGPGTKQQVATLGLLQRF